MSEKVIRSLAVADILVDEEFNTRGFIPPADVVELAQDIDRDGLIQPVVVQPWNADGFKYRMVAGHRRITAVAKILKRTHIEAIVREDLNEHTALLLNIRENLHRSNLNIMQEAQALGRFKKWNWSPAKVAEELKVNTRWVSVRYDLLGLHPDIQRRAAAGFLNQHQIAEIAALPTLDEQFERTREIVDWHLQGKKPMESKAAKAAKKAAAKGDPRSKAAIFEMQEAIQNLLCNNGDWGARCLAWSAGVISTDELFQDLEARCKEQRIPFRRPQVA